MRSISQALESFVEVRDRIKCGTVHVYSGLNKSKLNKISYNMGSSIQFIMKDSLCPFHSCFKGALQSISLFIIIACCLIFIPKNYIAPILIYLVYRPSVIIFIQSM